MKTIKFLTDTISLMMSNGTPSNIEVGTFKIQSKGQLHYWAGKTGTFDSCSISFDIEFRPDHIQKLKDMGVIFNFNTVKSSMSSGSPYYKIGRDAIKDGRYYKRGDGVSENWLTASASCGIHTLTKLDKYCRDNHLHHVAIHNDTVTQWNKPKYPYINPKKSLFYKSVRQNIAAKSKKYTELLPIEKLALKIK